VLLRIDLAGFVYKSSSRDNTGNICFTPRKNSQRVFQDVNGKYWSRQRFAPYFLRDFARCGDYSSRVAPTGVASSAAAPAFAAAFSAAVRRVRGVSRLNWRILYNSAL
jgi:hypothetical protein